MAAGITDADAVSTQFHRSSVNRFDFLGFTSRRVLGHKHHWDIVVDCERHSLFRG